MQQSYQWILAIIQSSTSAFHLECCSKMMELFASKYGLEKGGEDCYNLLIEAFYSKQTFISVDA